MDQMQAGENKPPFIHVAPATRGETDRMEGEMEKSSSHALAVPWPCCDVLVFLSDTTHGSHGLKRPRTRPPAPDAPGLTTVCQSREPRGAQGWRPGK